MHLVVTRVVLPQLLVLLLHWPRRMASARVHLQKPQHVLELALAWPQKQLCARVSVQKPWLRPVRQLVLA